ncbi:MAG TPA: DHA2 family efflux MFS transporter permease subunit [Steroidobacteraceae bacterium]|jgi:EmrB/QacA subfamily drug resistance transporter|nr:DHA2 family efflux MFS transporter permease subunit [Steroidobacteraceae bacterium]
MSTSAQAYCDAASARCVERSAPALHPRLVLVTSVLASSLAFVDGSVVNVALPAIGSSLSARADALQWTVNAYLLPLSAMLLLGGGAGDRFGRRRLLVWGTTLFALASLGCALAPRLGLLLAARFLQGIGGAMLMPNSLAILGQTFTREQKGRAVGIWAAASGIAGALGPVLGGWLIDLSSWRAIFLINLPIAGAAVAMALRYVPRDRSGQAGSLDVAGAVLVTAGLGVLTWSLTLAGGPAGFTRAAGLLGLGAIVLLVAFILVEARRGDQALAPMVLFTTPTLVGLNLLTLLLYGALGALLVLVPYVLIEALHYSAVQAGAALLPLPFVMVLISPFAGSLAERVGARMPIAIGAGVVGLGLLLTLRVGPSGSYWTGLLPAVTVVALGLSAAVAPLTAAVLGGVEARYTGVASGLNTAIARSGGLLATALVGFVLASHEQGLLHSFHLTMAIGCGVCCGAALCALMLVQRKSP